MPNADNGAAPTPKTGAETVMAEAPTEKPIDPVTAVGGVPTCAVALRVAAPAAVSDAGFSATLATPAALVRAVPAVGVIAARVASVLKVTTVLATAAPAASFNVAFAVAGAPVEMEVTVAPAASVSANVIVGTGVVVPVAVVAATAGVRPNPPEPQPARTARIPARNSNVGNVENSRFEKFRVK